MFNKEVIDYKEVKFKGIDGNELIFEVQLHKPEFVKKVEIINGKEKVVRRKENYIVENARIKMDLTNTELLEKISRFEKGDIFCLKYSFPHFADTYKIDKWKLVDILDEKDVWELQNRNTLIPCEFISRKDIQMYKEKAESNQTSKIDTQIFELEEEKANLESQLEKLQQQQPVNSLQDNHLSSENNTVMNMNEYSKKIIKVWFEVIFKEKGDDYIICDVIMEEEKNAKVPSELKKILKKSRMKQAYGEANAKLKLDTTNLELMEKVKLLKHKNRFIVEAMCPRMGRYYPEKWEVVDILDEFDLLELSNQNGLFTIDTPKKDKIFQPKGTNKNTSPKNIRLDKLKEEVIDLKIQLYNLQQQLENKIK